VSRSYASRVDEPPTLFLSDMQMVFDAQAVAERLDVEQRVNASLTPTSQDLPGPLPALAGSIRQLKT
jgi:hypothetical protein